MTDAQQASVFILRFIDIFAFDVIFLASSFHFTIGEPAMRTMACGVCGLVAMVLCVVGMGFLPFPSNDAKGGPRKQSAARKPLIGKKAGETRDDNQLGMKLIWCPPGTFKMGSPKKALGTKMAGYDSGIHWDEAQVTVTLSHGYWMGKYEVSQSEWMGVMGDNPSKHDGSDLPVESITWAEAIDFCKQFTLLEHKAGRLAKDWEYRLPTEAEWEYACRAGTTDYYFFGGIEEAHPDKYYKPGAAPKLFEYAWTGINSGDKIPSNRQFTDTRRTHPVGQKKANPWGFHDIIGNVMEMTLDWYHPQLLGGTDPVQTALPKPKIVRGKVQPPIRVVRGSYYIGSPGSCRVAMRGHVDPTKRYPAVGLRVVLAKVPKKPKAK